MKFNPKYKIGDIVYITLTNPYRIVAVKIKYITGKVTKEIGRLNIRFVYNLDGMGAEYSEYELYESSDDVLYALNINGVYVDRLKNDKE